MVLYLSGWQMCWFVIYSGHRSQKLHIPLLSSFLSLLWTLDFPKYLLPEWECIWSYVIYNPESSLTLLFFSYTHQTCQNIILASSRTYMQSDIPCEYFSVITNICYLYFCNNFLTGFTTFFPCPSRQISICLQVYSLLFALPLCASGSWTGLRSAVHLAPHGRDPWKEASGKEDTGGAY